MRKRSITERKPAKESITPEYLENLNPDVENAGQFPATSQSLTEK